MGPKFWYSVAEIVKNFKKDGFKFLDINYFYEITTRSRSRVLLNAYFICAKV